MSAALELGNSVGKAVACRVLGVPRATLYRRMLPATPRRVRPTPARALSVAERQVVLDHLHAQRSVSTSLRQVAREFSVYSLLSPVLVLGGLIQTAVGWGGCFGRACGKRSGLRA